MACLGAVIAVWKSCSVCPWKINCREVSKPSGSNMEEARLAQKRTRELQGE